MKFILATTYDIFGYLIPGIIGAFGFYLMVGWVSPFPDVDWNSVSATGWTGVLFACYLVGHFIQAGFEGIFVVFPLLRGEAIALGDGEVVSEMLKGRAREKVKELLKDPQTGEGEVSDASAWRFCEGLVQARGKSDALEIFIYRQGLYRGLIGGAFIVASGAVVRAGLHGDWTFTFGGAKYVFGTMWLLAVGGVAVLFLVVASCRYVAFSGYRVRHAFCSVVAPEP